MSQYIEGDEITDMEFKKNDFVVYGRNGVCLIEDIKNMNFGGDNGTYYILKPRSSNSSTVYVPVDKEGSQLLFRVISDSYESKSLILTTNLEFSKWGGIFTDDQMAAAMIDRLVHHGHLIIFEGRSYRMEHALMRQDA